MITGVTLNPCNDRTVTIPAFVYGGMNRIQSDRLDLAGKGYNVAKAVARLGEKAGATGFLYTENGAATQKSMEDDGVKVDCVWEKGRIRTNTKIFDLEKRVVTELNESGVFATAEALDLLADKVVEWAKCSGYLSFSGSLPPGCPNDYYKRLIKLAKPYCRTILDAEGEKLTQGILAQPFMIKPNLFELETSVGRSLSSIEEIKKAAIEIIDRGVSIVAVSLGGEGAFICNGRESYFAPRVDVVVHGTVAAGDCMVAGLSVGLVRGLPLKELFRMGVASATACVMQEGTGLVTIPVLNEVIGKVDVMAV